MVCSAFHQYYCQPDQWSADKPVGLYLVNAQYLSTNLACQPGMHTNSVWLGFMHAYSVQKTSQLHLSYKMMVEVNSGCLQGESRAILGGD